MFDLAWTSPNSPIYHTDPRCPAAQLLTTVGAAVQLGTGGKNWYPQCAAFYSHAPTTPTRPADPRPVVITRPVPPPPPRPGRSESENPPGLRSPTGCESPVV